MCRVAGRVLSMTDHLVIGFLMILIVFVPACGRTIEEEVISPLGSLVEQKTAASMETSVINVRTVRAALMRFPVNSPDNLYPDDRDVFDYESLRNTLTDENLPPDMSKLMWDPSYGVVYSSDGYTFTFEVRAFGNDGIITATPGGVAVNQ